MALALMAGGVGHAASIVWTNTLSGNWSDATSWNPNQIPGAADDAIITNAGSYLVTLDVPASVNSLTLGGGSGQQSLAAVNDLALSGSSTVQENGDLQLVHGNLGGSGLLTVKGRVDWTGGQIGASNVLTVATNGWLLVAPQTAGFLEMVGVLTNNGTITITNGGMRCIVFSGDGGGYGLLVNATNGLIDLQSNALIDAYNDNFGPGVPAVVNYGTVRKSNGTDTTSINPAFYNLGTLDAQSGGISLNGGGNGNGIFQAELGAQLAFASAYEVDGALTGAGTNLISNGVITLNGLLATANAVLTGSGVLTGTNLVIANRLDWTGGKIGAEAVVTVAATGSIYVAPQTLGFLDMLGVITNNGTITMTNGGMRCIVFNGYGGGYGLLVNATNGLIDLQSNGLIDVYNDNLGPGVPAVVNYGTVRKSNGTDTTPINPAFYNLGTLDAQSGAISLNGGGKGSGLFVAESGAAIDYPVNYELDGTILGAGTNFLTGGVFTFNGSIAGQFVWTSGQIGASSVGTVATNGLMRVAPPVVGFVDMLGVLTNSGTIIITEGGMRCIVFSGYGGGYGLLVNATNGLIDLQSNALIDVYDDNLGPGVPAVVNYGTVRKSNGTDTTLINPKFYNLGTLDAQSGIISLTTSYDLTGGTLNFGISSLTNFGQINLAGAATLTGTVSANLNQGYVPIATNTFPVLTYGSATGMFTNTSLPFADAWQTNYDATVFSLEVLNARPTLLANANQVVKELAQLSVTNHASDLDVPSQALSFSLLSPLTNMNIGASSGLFTWIPAQSQSPGTDTVAVVVTDSGTPPLSITNSFSIVVQEVNVAPALPAVTPTNVNELSLLTVTNTAAESNIHSAITGYGLVNPPAGASITTNGIITWTPTQLQSPGTNTFTTIVTNSNPYDLINPTLKSTNTFTVVVKEVNVPATLPTVATQIINELTLLTVTNSATNSNLHSTIIGYTLVNPPAGASITTSGIITWTPSQLQSPGTNTFTTIVTNNNPYDLINPSLKSTNTFTVVVKEVNVPATLPAVATQIVNELTLLTVTNSATNSNLHSTIIGYTLMNPPAGAGVTTNGIITWTPTQLQSPGTNTFTTIVTNSNPYDLINPSLKSTNTFTVVVKEVNVPATLPTVATQIVNELTLLTVTNSATNSNFHSTIIGYTVVSPPSNLVISASGIITWTPAQAQSPSTNLITTIVTNSNPYDLINPHLETTNFITVIVKEVNVAPVLPVISSQAVNVQALFTATNTAFETNVHATVGYLLVNPPTGMLISASGVITWTPSRSQGPGTNLITTVVTNADTLDLVNPHLSATNSFTLVVYAPTLAAIGNYQVNVGQTVAFTASAVDNDPTRILTYSLVSPPSGASLNSTSGLFNWRLATTQASTTNTVEVKVTDNSVPSLSDMKSFTVIVNPLAPVVLTPIGFTGGQFTFQVSGTAGPDYIITASTNLSGWSDIFTNPSPSTPFQYTNTAGTSLRGRFYRVRLSP